MTTTDLQNKIVNFKNTFLRKEEPFVYQQNNFDLFLDNVVIEIIKITKFILNSKTTMILKEKILKTVNSLIDKISYNKNFPVNKLNLDNKKLKN